MKQQKKSQKPIEIDAYLKYRCPNSKCNHTHWISLKEAQTKNFKIVCDSCDDIFKPKLVKDVIVKHHKKLNKPVETNVSNTEHIQNPIDNSPVISERLLTLCSKTLIDYGFTKKEAYDLLRQSYVINQTEQPFELIQHTLKMIGTINEPNIQTN
jgi:hypothetical protein